MIPEQGDVVSLNFDPSHNHEPTGRHYAVVLSPWRINRMSSLVVVAPVTSRDNGYPLHVRINDDNPVHGFAQCEAIRAMDYYTREAAGCAEVIGALDDDTVARILATVDVVLGRA